MNFKTSLHSLIKIAFCSFLLFLFAANMVYGGIAVRLKSPKGGEEKVELYGGSYALLIGAGNYRAGWPSLESIHGELDNVEDVLQQKGFTVVRVNDPDSRQLFEAFTNFINRYGYDSSNRLLFFYSGHGYTRKNGKKGYLVPVDAPVPEKDEKGFLTKALGMNHILSWSRDIEANHVLFLFDSCFSGTIFKLRDRAKVPPHISRLTALPVRQFITAGQAGESVPANSTFTPMFIDALKFGIADLNGDSYVSGTELGMFLQEKVPLHVNQSPQFGKIQDYDLSRGDFIFLAGLPDKQKKGQKNGSNSQPEPPAALSDQQGNQTVEPHTGMQFVKIKGDCYQMGQTALEQKEIVEQRGKAKYQQFFDTERQQIVNKWPLEKFLLHFKDEQPEHQVCVDTFWMGKYEVTQGQWQKLMGNNPARFQSGDSYPVEQVSWNQIQTFLEKLNKTSNASFRLPTEAEWEYAARSKRVSLSFSGGNDADGLAWHGGNSGGKTHKVGTRKPNDFGLYDMSGNVWEWCSDWYYKGYYSVSPRRNPKGPPTGKNRVVRGGSWEDGPFYLRVSSRNYSAPDDRDGYLGFRLMLPVN